MPHPSPTPTLDELLASVEKVDRVTIEVESPSRFVWRLFSQDREVAAVAGKPADLPSMLISTELLLSAEMGIAETSLCRHHPSLN